MNANEISPQPNLRMNRIKIVSRITKYVSYVFLTFSIGFNFWFVSSPLLAFKANVWRALLMVVFQIVLWVWYWKLARLFHFYERGLIFAAETIRCIKTLGLLCVMGWTLGSALHFVPRPEPQPQAALPPGVTIVKQTTHTYRMGFFSFDFGTGIDFGPLVIGAIIVLVAWIMDEGRKIQEEQELTV
jgi:hypothetical protein